MTPRKRLSSFADALEPNGVDRPTDDPGAREAGEGSVPSPDPEPPATPEAAREATEAMRSRAIRFQQERQVSTPVDTPAEPSGEPVRRKATKQPAKRAAKRPARKAAGPSKQAPAAKAVNRPERVRESTRQNEILDRKETFLWPDQRDWLDSVARGLERARPRAEGDGRITANTVIRVLIDHAMAVGLLDTLKGFDEVEMLDSITVNLADVPDQ